MASQPQAPNPYQTASAQTSQNTAASNFNTITGNANATNPTARSATTRAP